MPLRGSINDSLYTPESIHTVMASLFSKAAPIVFNGYENEPLSGPSKPLLLLT